MALPLATMTLSEALPLAAGKVSVGVMPPVVGSVWVDAATPSGTTTLFCAATGTGSCAGADAIGDGGAGGGAADPPLPPPQADNESATSAIDAPVRNDARCIKETLQ
ncbi:MAG: hypothetical protein NVS2B17_32050 [Candidatus Velthaea sp.]